MKSARSCISFLVLATIIAVGAALPGVASATEAAAAPTSAQASERAQAARDAAADRRAKESAFERVELDQGAFESGARRAEARSRSGGGSIVRMLFGLAVVVGAIFGVQWLLKRWAASKLDGVRGHEGLIDVVSTTVLSQGRTLHLIRVADELVLVGATEQSITRLGTLDATALVGDIDGTLALPSATRAQLASAGRTQGGTGFEELLSSSAGTATPAAVAPMTEGPILTRFIYNLKLSTAR